jgi:ubiquinone/menaquinone biosynthesis C-methylase UbiE
LKIDFNKAFAKGYRSYEGDVGDWWVRQSRNPAHRRAYRKIADVLRSTVRHPKFIVDYASGNAEILKFLVRAYPDTRLVALDGSRHMLLSAKRALEKIGYQAEFVPVHACARETGPRIRLVQTPLPDAALPRKFADVVLFLFPNMNATVYEMARIRKHGNNRSDVMLARLLSRLSVADPDEDCDDAEELCEELLHARAVSKNIHRLLRRNGMLLKADYSEGLRESLSEIASRRLLYGESALDIRVGRKKNNDRFRFADSHFSRSAVTLDVYQQTRNPDDKRGGYIVSTFRAR